MTLNNITGWLDSQVRRETPTLPTVHSARCATFFQYDRSRSRFPLAHEQKRYREREREVIAVALPQNYVYIPSALRTPTFIDSPACTGVAIKSAKRARRQYRTPSCRAYGCAKLMCYIHIMYVYAINMDHVFDRSISKLLGAELADNIQITELKKSIKDTITIFKIFVLFLFP